MNTLTLLQLKVNNFQIIDITPNPDQLAASLIQGHDYELRICIRNVNTNDTTWYDNIQLRVVPISPAVQFFVDSSYQTQMFRFDGPLFALRSNSSRWFTIPFRWTGNRRVSATSVTFDTGLYAHELPISNGWRKLKHPI